MNRKSNDMPDDQFLALVNIPDEDALLADIEKHFAGGCGFSVATLNLDHIVKLKQDIAFREAYEKHTHVVADGNPIVWLRKAMGKPVKLVPGANLVKPLSALAARTQTPTALLGSTDETLLLAADQLMTSYPDLEIADKIAPGRNFDPFGPEADAALLRLAQKKVGLCFLALGAPKQEILAARAKEIAPDCGFVSIGAGLDFIAKTQNRAPVWVQKIAMEWLWRLLTNPARLARRYAQCFAILPGLYWSARRSGQK